jgi:hypothetical protein
MQTKEYEKVMSSIKHIGLSMREDYDPESETVLSVPVGNSDPVNILESMGTDIKKLGKYISDNYTPADFILPLVEFETDDDNTISHYFSISKDNIKSELRNIAKELTNYYKESRYYTEGVELRFGKVSGNYALLAYKK